MGGWSAQAPSVEENAVKGLLNDVNNNFRCQIMNRSIVNDGHGGYITTWTEGAVFDAAIASNTSMEAKTAQAAGVRDTYSIYTDAALVLMFNTVFKRLSDNKTFRVTSDGDEKQTPSGSALNLRMVTAEEWSIPTA